MTTPRKPTFARLRSEQRALLVELDQLAQGTATPVSFELLATVSLESGGSMHPQPAPRRAMPHHLRYLRQKGLITLEGSERKAQNGSLNWSESFATVTDYGRDTLRPAQSKRLTTPVTPPPTWRGDCMRERADSSPFDALQRPPVLRRGAEDFRACASRGM